MSGTRELLGDKMQLMLVKIVNPRVPVNLGHQSESEIYNTPDEDFDLVIRNTSDLKDLMGDIESFADDVLDVVA